MLLYKQPRARARSPRLCLCPEVCSRSAGPAEAAPCLLTASHLPFHLAICLLSFLFCSFLPPLPCKVIVCYLSREWQRSPESSGGREPNEHTRPRNAAFPSLLSQAICWVVWLTGCCGHQGDKHDTTFLWLLFCSFSLFPSET